MSSLFKRKLADTSFIINMSGVEDVQEDVSDRDRKDVAENHRCADCLVDFLYGEESLSIKCCYKFCCMLFCVTLYECGTCSRASALTKPNTNRRQRPKYRII